MVGDRLNDLVMQRPRLAGNAKGAIRHSAPSAPRNLGKLGGKQRAHPLAIKF
jgi:hypothetical protein